MEDEYESISSNIVQCRLRLVQQLLQGEVDQSQHHLQDEVIECILIVLGSDGAYNQGSSTLANYIFFDVFDKTIKYSERYDDMHSALDDLVMVIDPYSIELYCNPINYQILHKYLINWSNAIVHCQSDKEFSEYSDASQKYKSEMLHKMLQNYTHIYIPSIGNDQCNNRRSTHVLKWPIFQDFNVQFEGKRIIRNEIDQIYNVKLLRSVIRLLDRYDPVKFEHLLTTFLPNLQQQWQLFLNNLDASSDALSLEEDVAAEPLRSYFYHKPSVEVGVPAPFVLYGVNSTRRRIEGHLKTSNRFKSATARTSGLSGKPALHLLCYGRCPDSKAACLRTYFLDRSFTHFSSDPFLPVKSSSTDRINTRALECMYRACVCAVQHAIKIYAETLDTHLAEKVAFRTLSEQGRGHNCRRLTSFLVDTHKIHFEITSIDDRDVTSAKEEYSATMKYVSLILSDIPGPDGQESLGSVGFGDSFLHSRIAIKSQKENRRFDADYFIVTQNIPHFASWTSDDCIIKNFMSGILLGRSGYPDKLGELILRGRDIKMADEDAIYGIGDLFIFEGGLIHTDSRNGHLFLPRGEIERIGLYDGVGNGNSSLDLPTVLMITYKQSAVDHIPQLLISRSRTLYLIILPHSLENQEIYKSLLPRWRALYLKPDIDHVNEFPEEIESKIHTIKGSQLNHATPSKLQQALDEHASQRGFLKHLSLSTCLANAEVDRRHIDAIFDRSAKQIDDGSDDKKLILTVIIGIPGTHQELLASKLTEINQEETDWRVIKEYVPNTKYNSGGLQRRLSLILKEYEEQKSRAKKLRVLIVITGFVDARIILDALQSHPNDLVNQNIRVGGITCCIDPGNFFIDHRNMMPKIADQLAPGLVNCVVLKHSESEEDMRGIRKWIRDINPGVAILLSDSRYNLERCQDTGVILETEAFEQADMIKQRYLTLANLQLRSSSDYPKILLDDVRIMTNEEFDEVRLRRTFCLLRSCLGTYPYTGNIYYIKGIIRLAGTIQGVTYCTLRNDLQLVQRNDLVNQMDTASPQEEAMDCFLTFTGINLKDELLETVIRNSTKQMQKPSLKRTRATISRIELNAIQAKCRLEPPPEGWYYTGRYYVSMDGERSYYHPNLEEFVSQYLLNLNIQVDRNNEQIRAALNVDGSTELP